MIIIGLTGSIGMGKSTAAGMFRGMGLPVYDSDREVHRLLERGGAAVSRIDAAFPGVVKDGAVDRGLLGQRVFGDESALAQLEGIVHPLVRRVQDRFLRRCAMQRRAIAVLDIPLLFELGLDGRCDATVVVTAPGFLQEARVLRRPGMSKEKLAGILERQMQDSEKCARADFLVKTGGGKRMTRRRLGIIVGVVSRRPGRRWPPRSQTSGAARNRHA